MGERVWAGSVHIVRRRSPRLDQLSFFAAGDPPLLKKIRAIDPETMTPKEALDLLFELHKQSRSPGDR